MEGAGVQGVGVSTEDLNKLKKELFFLKLEAQGSTFDLTQAFWPVAIEEDKKEKSRDEKKKRQDDKRVVKDAPKETGKEVEKALIKVNEKENIRVKTEQLMDLLSTQGKTYTPEQAETWTTGIVKSKGMEIPPELKGVKGLSKVFPATGATPAKDLILQVGAGGVKFAQRVDPGDVGVFAKPGGALSKAGRAGGEGTNVYHIYGPGPAVLESIKRAQSAGMIR